MTYLSTQYLTSGLVAVLFTSIIFFNMVNGRLIFGTPVERRVLLAAATGMLGVALLFLPELQVGDGRPAIVHGALLALAATYVASLGNMAAMRNTRAGLPVVTVNAYGMAYGTLGLAVIAASAARRSLSIRPGRTSCRCFTCRSFGTALAFGLYLALHQAHRRRARRVHERVVPGRGTHRFDAVRRLSVEPAGVHRAGGAGGRQCACARAGRAEGAVRGFQSYVEIEVAPRVVGAKASKSLPGQALRRLTGRVRALLPADLP